LRHAVSLKNTAWRVVLDITPESHSAPIRDAALALLAAVLGATVIGWLAGALASRGLARSVKSLSDPAAPAGAAIVEIEAARQRTGSTRAPCRAST